MRHKQGRFVSSLLALALLSTPGFAQEQKKRKTASNQGTTGLFETWDAETLRRGEFNFVVGFEHFNRDPGELVFKTVPAALAIGLHDRIEFFEVVEAVKRIDPGSTQIYGVPPGRSPRPARTPLGATSFTNAAPFIDVPVTTNRGDFLFGVKANLMSERQGYPFAMSFVGFLKVPGSKSTTDLNRGLGTGAIEGGYGYLFSKRAGNVAQLHLNTLINFVKDPKIGGVTLANLQNYIHYKAGAAFPTYGQYQFITEVDGMTYFGTRTTGLNPKSPLDVILGARAYLTDRLSAGVGYRASLNHVREDAANQVFPAGINGWVAQLGYGVRRNEPPSISCAVADSSILQDASTTVRASAIDPDGDALTYSWSASGGRISGAGDTVTFDATGVAPGSYSVSASVSDGHYSSSCSTDIAVAKKNVAPTVSCAPASSSIIVGESSTVTASASDPNNDSLKYSWTVNGQRLAADGATVTFGSTGRKPGSYKVEVTVSDGELTASCASTVMVAEKPNRQPAINCLTTTIDVASGSSAELRASASDPDNDKTTISWSASNGSVRGSGDRATFDASGVRAGIVTVTATANDGRGGRASCTMTVKVSETIRLIREGKIPCGVFAAGRNRLDNCAKAILDDIAVRMQSEPRLHANVVGYTDGSSYEKSRKGLGAKRAQAAADYLVSKGIDQSRLTVTDGGAANPIDNNSTASGRRMNRRVEVELAVR